MNCPICNLPMVHSRLRGYHCHNENHNEQAREMELAALPGEIRDLLKKLDQFKNKRYYRPVPDEDKPAPPEPTPAAYPPGYTLK